MLCGFYYLICLRMSYHWWSHACSFEEGMVVYPPFPHTEALLPFLITMEFVIAAVTSLTLNFQATYFSFSSMIFFLYTDGLWLSYHRSVKNWWFLFPSFYHSIHLILLLCNLLFTLFYWFLNCLEFIAGGNSLAIFLNLVCLLYVLFSDFCHSKIFQVQLLCLSPICKPWCLQVLLEGGHIFI